MDKATIDSVLGCFWIMLGDVEAAADSELDRRLVEAHYRVWNKATGNHAYPRWVKLVDGCVPAGVECPYKSKCEIFSAGACKQRAESKIPFSCAAARSFEITTK